MVDHDRDDDDNQPTVNQPLNAAPRPTWKPILMLLGLVAALALFYFFGLEVLVPAD